MVSYRLLYFDQTGRGEILRFLFALGGQKYEDVIISQESWPKFKQTVPFGVLPVLEIDGKRYSQSVALAVYLAKQFGYNGKTDLESLAVLEVVQLVQD
ncbi:probable glutathione S-transferase 5, partial [Aplysia californica]|uniref:Probable glutathione S-transferase 5 n=1 Tax=Aplysia californica TaxID=6500 RepID=A0ABM0KA96_APLCA